MAVNYQKAPPEWNYKCPNPFTCDGSYGSEWSCFQILESGDDRQFYGRSQHGLRNFGYSLAREGLEGHLADFVRYESGHGRSVIVSGPPDLDIDALAQRALANTPEGPIVRDDDPRWVVHSTLLEAWKRIEACGELRSLGRLKREGSQVSGGLGFEEFGEPPDYAEHVVLGHWEGIGAEHVVASYAKGRVFTEEDAPYEPGVRLYFDCHAIVRHGLAVRDGVHLMKVCDHLPLEPYLVAAIGVKEVDPEGTVSAWTPRSFLERANTCFESLIAGK